MQDTDDDYSDTQASLSYNMSGLTTLPMFPDNIPTHPLLVIDYELLKMNDRDEVDKLWKAATELGFW